MRRSRFAVPILLVAALVAVPGTSEEAETATRTFSLAHIQVRDAWTLLKVVVGLERFESPGEKELHATGTPGHLELAGRILEAVDSEKPKATRLAAGDDSSVAVIPLLDTPPMDALAALRELNIAKMTVHTEPDVLVIRDTTVQVDAALEAIQKLRGSS